MQLIDRILELSKDKERFIIAIDGPCASGKSTLANKLKEELNAQVFHMDDYFLPTHMVTVERLNQIGGNIHYERMLKEVHSNLLEENITYQKFNCSVNKLENKESVGLSKFIIIEGAYSMRKDMREYYDFKILLDVDPDVQIERLRKRNEKLLLRFINDWIPLENRYFKVEQLEKIADEIIVTDS